MAKRGARSTERGRERTSSAPAHPSAPSIAPLTRAVPLSRDSRTHDVLRVDDLDDATTKPRLQRPAPAPAVAEPAELARDERESLLLDEFFSWPPPPADVTPPPYEAPRMSRESRRAMWATVIMLTVSLLGLASFVAYHHFIMPAPVELSETDASQVFELPSPIVASDQRAATDAPRSDLRARLARPEDLAREAKETEAALLADEAESADQQLAAADPAAAEGAQPGAANTGTAEAPQPSGDSSPAAAANPAPAAGAQPTVAANPATGQPGAAPPSAASAPAPASAAQAPSSAQPSAGEQPAAANPAQATTAPATAPSTTPAAKSAQAASAEPAANTASAANPAQPASAATTQPTPSTASAANPAQPVAAATAQPTSSTASATNPAQPSATSAQGSGVGQPTAAALAAAKPSQPGAVSATEASAAQPTAAAKPAHASPTAQSTAAPTSKEPSASAPKPSTPASANAQEQPGAAGEGASFDELVAQARKLVAQGDPKQALLAYDRALQPRPHAIEALVGKATALLALKDYDAAKSTAEQAVALDPSNRDGLMLIGSSWEQLGNKAAAKDVYQRCVDRATESRSAPCRQRLDQLDAKR